MSLIKIKPIFSRGKEKNSFQRWRDRSEAVEKGREINPLYTRELGTASACFLGCRHTGCGLVAYRVQRYRIRNKTKQNKKPFDGHGLSWHFKVQTDRQRGHRRIYQIYIYMIWFFPFSRGSKISIAQKDIWKTEQCESCHCRCKCIGNSAIGYSYPYILISLYKQYNLLQYKIVQNTVSWRRSKAENTASIELGQIKRNNCDYTFIGHCNCDLP